MSEAASRNVEFVPMQAPWLDAVVAVEQQAHPHPWNRRNFEDALAAGNVAQLLVAGDVLLGYFVAMQVLDEVHLLNITVAPAYQRQGWSRTMLKGLNLWARGHGAQSLWLEARVGNLRALGVYRAHGFAQVGLRKAYYPAAQSQREDAVVMRLGFCDPLDS